jgi:hypothetical protein
VIRLRHARAVQLVLGATQFLVLATVLAEASSYAVAFGAGAVLVAAGAATSALVLRERGDAATAGRGLRTAAK